ncbi:MULTISPECIES: ogr/Delta-like zinc finger family protein [Xanthomonas]|uniref:ogr/Delta-like zinc finger family protein n=1 Tax=Xanthomonas TaxID=338 RepID=UPI00141BEA90|nr:MULTISPECIES: ogr/Delta-like zinc finger family protein [Xanthomonas]NIK64378.1 hypothetical protein [Xanthomonas cannabis]
MTIANRAFMRCPHCDQPAVVRSSLLHTKLLRESMLQCRNALCGHTFSAFTEIVRTISPSACPSDEICLPIINAAEKAALKAKLAEAQVARKGA